MTEQELHEKIVGQTAEKLKGELGDVSEFKKLDDEDWNELGAFFKEKGATAVVFAPDVIRTFIDFSKDVGFPFTRNAAERGGLETARYNTDTLLNILTNANVIEYVTVPAKQALDAKHTDDEDREFRANGRKRVKLYELDDEFRRKFTRLMKKAGVVKFEETDYDKTKEEQSMGKEKIENIDAIIERLNTKFESLNKKITESSDATAVGEAEAAGAEREVC